MRVLPTEIISNWNHRVEGLQQSTKTFYDNIEHALRAHKSDHIKVERVHFSEGGIASRKREYLQVRRGEQVFHVCAAPFADGFFVSWWLGHRKSGLFEWLAGLPVIGFIMRRFVTPITYYQLDTAYMFQSLTSSCVEKVLNAAIEEKGLRALAREDYKPTMRDIMSAKT